MEGAVAKLASGPTWLAPTCTRYSPPLPRCGVPEMVAVPSPWSTRPRPSGSEPATMAMEGTGYPNRVIEIDTGAPATTWAAAGDVKLTSSFTTSFTGNDTVPEPLAADTVRSWTPP